MTIAQSASVSDNDVKRNQASGSLEKSSKEFIGGDAVSQSSSSVFDRNAF